MRALERPTQTSNPFSTGGGGTTFEHLVGTSYLVSLLCGEIPRGLSGGHTIEVGFQRRWAGTILDDVVVVSEEEDTLRRLFLQVKHNITFNISDPTLNRVIRECWRTFAGETNTNFDSEKDRLAIGIGVYNNKIEHLQSLLDWARTSISGEEFHIKVSTEGFSSKEKRHLLELFKESIASINEVSPSDEQIWGFLKCLVVIHFDLEHTGSRDSTHAWNRLRDQVVDRNEGQAIALHSELLKIVPEYARTGGTIDYESLRARIPVSISIAGRSDYPVDLKALRIHSQETLDDISITIGNRVSLPRERLLDQIADTLVEKDAVLLHGEPMVGKSGLLKLLEQKLGAEGQVLTFSVKRLQGTSLRGFLSDLGVRNEMGKLLTTLGSSPLRCILIDGLELTIGDDARRQVLNDLLNVIHRHNEELKTNETNPEYCWKLVITCRTQERMNVLLHLETRKMMLDGVLEQIKVPGLSADEINVVVNQFPQIRELSQIDRLNKLISLPLVLDILTLPEATLGRESIPEVLTESWLKKWFWNEIVRLAEGMRPGQGGADEREKVLIEIANSTLLGEESTGDVDTSDAVRGLVSDRLIYREDNEYKFTHDAIRDWTYINILDRAKDDIPQFLRDINEKRIIMRALRVFSASFLELSNETNEWLELINQLEEADLSPVWHQTVLSALLYSPLLNQLLPVLDDVLFSQEQHVLYKLLWSVRKICVQPSPMASTLVGAFPDHEFEKYAAYMTLPMWEQWIPLMDVCLNNANRLTARSWFEFSNMLVEWMKNTKEDDLYRQQAAELCSNLLNDEDDWDIDANIGDLSFEDIRKFRENLQLSLLWASDCSPVLVKSWINRIVIDEPNNHRFFDLILEEGWLPLCKNLPETGVDVILQALCRDLEPDPYGSYHSAFMHLGMRHTRWNPPTPFKGPFLFLLTLHPVHGIRLVNGLISHATTAWKMREEIEFGNKPLPQTLDLGERKIELWGDHLVYRWFRYPAVASDPICTALMALENWLDKQLQEGENPEDLFQRVLRDATSVAQVGVCTSVALAHMDKCQNAILPIIENPAFWAMDIDRLTQDLTSPATIEAFSGFFAFGNEKDYQNLINSSNKDHRRRDIRSFVLPILFTESEENQKRLQDALRAFPEIDQIYYEGEEKDAGLLDRRKETRQIWAAMAERENYRYFETGVEGRYGIQFQMPKELEERERPRRAYLERTNRLHTHFNWVKRYLFDGEKDESIQLETIAAYAKQLAQQDNPSHNPSHFLEDSETIARFLAAFAAVFAIREWDWLVENGYKEWCVRQLIIAATRPQPSEQAIDDYSIFPDGYRRSAARALPFLWMNGIQTKRLRKCINALSVSANKEVRSISFGSLRILWNSAPRLVWENIRSLIFLSARQAIIDKHWYLRGRRGVVVEWGRFGNVKKKLKQIIALGQILQSQILHPSIRKSTTSELGAHYLESLLYCFPSDNSIDECLSKAKCRSLLKDLISYTINNYTKFQTDRGEYNEFAHSNWSRIFMKLLANAILRSSDTATSKMLISPILDAWPKSPTMLENLLMELCLNGSHPETQGRLVEYWPMIGENVFQNISSDLDRFFISTSHKSILGLLVFTDQHGAFEWQTEDWAPIHQLSPFITKWVKTVGHYPECLPSLVRFLRTIGFSIFVEFGIDWLETCILNLRDSQQYFDRSNNSRTLAHLLHDAWARFGQEVTQDHQKFKSFSALVDLVADQGEEIAIQLQRKYQNYEQN